MRMTRRRMVQSLLAAGSGAMWPSAPGRAGEEGRFDPAEREALGAACERLFPGARAAGVLDYLDYWLQREPFLATEREFKLGARHLDRLARESRRKAFAALSGEDQDAILRRLQEGGVRTRNFDGAGFFVRLLSFTVEAVFGDRRYGGGGAGIGEALVGRRGCWWNPVSGVGGTRAELPEE